MITAKSVHFTEVPSKSSPSSVRNQPVTRARCMKNQPLYFGLKSLLYLSVLVASCFESTQAANCFQRTYPKLVGSTEDADVSSITSIEINEVDQVMYVGGTSSDTNIVGSVDTPIVGQFLYSTETWGWRSQYSTTLTGYDVSYSYVSSIAASPNRQYLLVIIEGYPIIDSFPVAFTVAASSGTILTPETIAQNGQISWTVEPDATRLDNGGLAYIVFTKSDPLDPANRFQMSRIDTLQPLGASALEYGVKTASVPARISSVKFRLSGNSFVAAGMLVTSNPSLVIFQLAASDGSDEWTLIADQNGGEVALGGFYDYISYIDLFVSGGQEFIFGVAQGTSVTALNRGFSFVKVELPLDEAIEPTVTAIRRYSPIDGRVFECTGVSHIDTNILQGLMYDVSSQTIFYVKYDFTGTQFDMINMYSNVKLNVANSYFSGVQTGFFVGSLNQFGTLQTYNNNYGFILEIDPSRNCIDFGTVVETYTVFTPPYSFVSQRRLGLTNLQLSPIDGLFTSAGCQIDFWVNPNGWCAVTYDIFPATLGPLTYFLGSAPLTPTFSEFTIAAVCDDMNWFYAESQGPTLTNEAVVTLAPSSRNLSIQTANQADVGIHEFYIKGTIPNGQFVTMTVQLDIVPDCDTAVMQFTQTGDEDYIMTETQEDYFYAEFTHQYPLSYCPITYTVTDELGNSLDDIFTYDPATRKISVFSATLDTLKVKLWEIKVTASTGTTVSESMSFFVDVLDPCENGANRAINTSQFPDFSYDLYAPLDTRTWTNTNGVTSVRSTTLCGDWNWLVTMVDDNALDTRAFSTNDLTSATKEFYTEARDLAMIGPHDIKVTAWQGVYNDPTQVATHIFRVTIINLCSSAYSLTAPAALGTQTYVLSKPSQDSPAFGQCTKGPSYCPQATDYTFSVDNVGVETDVVSLTNSTRTFSYFHPDADLYEGTYTVTVTCSDGVVSDSFTYTLILQNPCKDGATRTFTPVKFVDSDYNLNAPQITYTWVDIGVESEVTSTETEAICGDWQFSLEMNTAPTPTVLNADAFSTTLPTTFTYSVYSILDSMIGPHEILVTAWQGPYTDYAIQMTFTITIIDVCETALITPSAYQDQYYWLGRLKQTVRFAAFTSAFSYCDSEIEYSLVTQTDTDYERNLISEDLANGALEISWFHPDNKLYAGAYPLRVKGAYKSNVVFFDFVLYAIDPCTTAVRTVDATPYWDDVTYNILDTEYQKTWTDAVVSVNETMCGDWNYQFLFANGTVVTETGTAIHMDNTVPEFQVYSSDQTLFGTFPITFKAWQTGYDLYPTTDVFNVNIANACRDSATLTPGVNVIQDFTYVLTKNLEQKPFDAFISLPDYCPITYKLVNQDGTDLTATQQEWIKFFPDPTTERYAEFYHGVADTHETTGLTLKVVGTGLGATAEFLFTIIAENPCKDGPNGAIRTYAGPELSDSTYNLRTVKVTETWTDSIVSSSETTDICGPWSYTLTMADDSDLDVRAFESQLPTIQDFSVFSTDEDMIGDHTIKLTAWQGTYNDPALLVVHTFIVTIEDLCPTAVIYPSTPVDQSYVLRQSAQSYDFPAFTASISYCPFDYVFSVTPAIPDIVTNVVTFDGTLDGDTDRPNDLEFIYSSLDVSYAGVYTVTVTGSLGASEQTTAIATYELELIHPCAVAALTVDASSFIVSHPRGPALNIAWTIDGTVSSDIEVGVDCGPIIVEFAKDVVPEEPIDPDVFTDTRTNDPNMSFDVETTDFAKVGPHPMIMRAYYQNFNNVVDTDQFTVTITDPCAPPNWLTPLPDLVDQEYQLLEVGTTYSVLNAFTSIQSPSFCPMSLDFIAVKDGDTANPSKFPGLITFDGTLDGGATDGVFTFEDLVDHQTYAGTYEITVTATAGTTAESNQPLTFFLTVIDPCSLATFTLSTLIDQEYVLSDPFKDYAFTPYDVVPAYCPVSYTYTAVLKSDGSPANLSSAVTLDGTPDSDADDPADLTFRFETFDHALIPDFQKSEVYTISLVASTTGVVSDPGLFDLTVFDPCQYAVISFDSTVFVDYTYTLFDTTNAPVSWTDATAASSTEPESLCNEFEYFFHTGDGTTAIDTAIFTIDYTNKNKVTYSEDFTLAETPGTYDVFVDVWHRGHKLDTKQTVQYTVTFVDPCPSANVTAPTLANNEYYLTTPELVIPYDAFVVDPAYCPIAQTLTYTDSSAFEPGLITFDKTARTIKFFYDNIDLYEGTYNMRLQGAYKDNVDFIDFDVVVLNPCRVLDRPVSSVWPDWSYQIFDTPIDKFWTDAFMNPDPRTTEALCGEWVYEITLNNGDALDPLIFQLDYGTQKLTTYSEQFDAPGVYTLRFRGWHFDWPAKFGEATFVVKIVDVCPTSNLAYLGDDPEATITYIASANAITWTHADFVDTTGKCGAIELSAQYQSGFGLIAFGGLVQYDATSGTFTFFTDFNFLANTYPLEFTATLSRNPTLYPTKTINFDLIVVKCQAQTLTPSSISDLTYRVRDPQIDLPILPFTVEPQCAFTYSYQVQQNYGGTYSDVDPQFLTYNSDTQTLSVYALSGVEQTITIRVTGNLSQNGGSTFFEFRIKIREENYAPYYLQAPGNYTLLQRETLDVPIWDWEDPDQDAVTHEFSLGLAERFVRYDPSKGELIIEPTISQHVGRWPVQVEIRDLHPRVPLFTRYTFYITVIPVTDYEWVGVNEAPYLNSTLEDVHLTYGVNASQTILVLPERYDLENDTIEVTINVGSATPFMEVFKQGQDWIIVIDLERFKAVNTQLGFNELIQNYQVEVFLSDDNPFLPATRAYRFDVLIDMTGGYDSGEEVVSSILYDDDYYAKLVDFLTDCDITSPNRIGEVSLIWSKDWIPTGLTADLIDSSILDIQLRSYDGVAEPDKQLFTWSTLKVTPTHILVQLDFDHELYISKFQDQKDVLKVKIIRPEVFIGSPVGRMLGAYTIDQVVNEHGVYDSRVYKQFRINWASIITVRLFEFLKVAFTMFFLFWLVLTIPFAREHFWLKCSALQICYAFGFINLSFPVDALVAFKLLESTAFFNFGLNTVIYRAIFGYSGDYKVTSAQYFEMELEDHNLMVVPSGIWMALTIVVPLSLLMVLLTRIHRNNKSKWTVFLRKLRLWVVWGSVLRVLLVGCFGLVFCSMHHLRYNKSETPGLNTLAAMTIIFYLCFAAFIFIVSLLPETKFERLQLDTLFYNTRQSSPMKKAFFGWYIIRRLILAFVIVFWEKSPSLQIAVALITTMLQLCYMAHYKPLIDGEVAFLEAFNEFCIFFICMCMFVFDEYSDTLDSTQFDFGFIVCLLIYLIIVINTFAGIARMIKNILLRVQQYLLNQMPKQISEESSEEEIFKTYKVRGGVVKPSDKIPITGGKEISVIDEIEASCLEETLRIKSKEKLREKETPAPKTKANKYEDDLEIHARSISMISDLVDEKEEARIAAAAKKLSKSMFDKTLGDLPEDTSVSEQVEEPPFSARSKTDPLLDGTEVVISHHQGWFHTDQDSPRDYGDEEVNNFRLDEELGKVPVETPLESSINSKDTSFASRRIKRKQVMKEKEFDVPAGSPAPTRPNKDDDDSIRTDWVDENEDLKEAARLQKQETLGGKHLQGSEPSDWDLSKSKEIPPVNTLNMKKTTSKTSIEEAGLNKTLEKQIQDVLNEIDQPSTEQKRVAMQDSAAGSRVVSSQGVRKFEETPVHLVNKKKMSKAKSNHPSKTPRAAESEEGFVNYSIPLKHRKTQREPRAEKRAQTQARKKKIIPEQEDPWKDQRPKRKATILEKNDDSLDLFETEQSEQLVAMPGTASKLNTQRATMPSQKPQTTRAKEELLKIPIKDLFGDQSSLNEHESDMDIRDALSNGVAESDGARTIKRRNYPSTNQVPDVQNVDNDVFLKPGNKTHRMPSAQNSAGGIQSYFEQSGLVPSKNGGSSAQSKNQGQSQKAPFSSVKSPKSGEEISGFTETMTMKGSVRMPFNQSLAGHGPMIGRSNTLLYQNDSRVTHPVSAKKDSQKEVQILANDLESSGMTDFVNRVDPVSAGQPNLLGAGLEKPADDFASFSDATIWADRNLNDSNQRKIEQADQDFNLDTENEDQW